MQVLTLSWNQYSFTFKILGPFWIRLNTLPMLYKWNSKALMIAHQFTTWFTEYFKPTADSSVQLLSRVRVFATPWTATRQASLKVMSKESVIPSNHLILWHPLLLLPSIFPSIRVFSNESVLWIRWPKCWSFSFSIIPSINIQDWFPLGLTSLISLQSKGPSRVFSNTTVQKHQFFGAQLSL